MDSFPEIEIAEYKIFDESNNNNDDNVLNISYGVDENYLDGVGVSIASVVLNNNIPLAFHIICDSYSPCFVKYIERLAVQHHIKISLYLIKVRYCLKLKYGREQCIFVYLLSIISARR